MPEPVLLRSAAPRAADPVRQPPTGRPVDALAPAPATAGLDEGVAAQVDPGEGGRGVRFPAASTAPSSSANASASPASRVAPRRARRAPPPRRACDRTAPQTAGSRQSCAAAAAARSAVRSCPFGLGLPARSGHGDAPHRRLLAPPSCGLGRKSGHQGGRGVDAGQVRPVGRRCRPAPSGRRASPTRAATAVGPPAAPPSPRQDRPSPGRCPLVSAATVRRTAASGPRRSGARDCTARSTGSVPCASRRGTRRSSIRRRVTRAQSRAASACPTASGTRPASAYQAAHIRCSSASSAGCS